AAERVSYEARVGRPDEVGLAEAEAPSPGHGEGLDGKFHAWRPCREALAAACHHPQAVDGAHGTASENSVHIRPSCCKLASSCCKLASSCCKFAVSRRRSPARGWWCGCRRRGRR